MAVSRQQYQQIAKRSGRLPAAPTRDAACGIQCSLQGDLVHLDGDPWHWWDPYLTDPEERWRRDKTARLSAYRELRALGRTHLSLSVDGSYYNPDGPLTSLTEILPIMQEAIIEGGYTAILLNLKGDGSGTPDYDPEHFDPGSAGFPALMRLFPEIHKRVEDAGLVPFTVYSPGFDGVIPAWQPFTRVNEYIQMARGVTGDAAYHAIEPAGGYCVWSGEENDWATADGQKFDVILQEFANPMAHPAPPPPYLLDANGNWLGPDIATADQRAPWDQQWQMVGRMVSPYHRPSEQPPNDDGGGAPFLLSAGTPRGPFFYIGYEYDTYQWIRRGDSYPMDAVVTHGRYLQQLGVSYICGPLRRAA